MTHDRRTLVLDERDLVLLTAGTREALHAAVTKLYEGAKRRVEQAGDRVDQETGEVTPRVWRLVFAEADDDITAKQRGFFHAAVLPQIAEQVRVDGERYTAEVWKEYFRKLFLPDRFVMRRLPGHKRATPQRVRVSTENLGVKGYSEHIDKVIAHAETEFGVAFVFDRQEREAVRYRRPARRQAHPTTQAEMADQ
jgi:hypothetical protein